MTGRREAAPRVPDLGGARHRCGVGCGMPPIVEPRLRLEIEKESLLVCLSPSPSARGANPKSCLTRARAMRRHKTAHLFLPSPFFRREAREESVGKAADLSQAPPCQLGWAGAQPAGDPAGARGSPRLRHPLSVFVFPARPPFGKAFPLRAYCARGVLAAHRGRSGAPIAAAPSLASQPLFLGAVARGQAWLSTL